MRNSESKGLLRKINNFLFKSPSQASPDEVQIVYRTDFLSLARFHRRILQSCFHKEDLETVRDFITAAAVDDYVVILAEKNNEIVGGVVVEHSWSTDKEVMLIAWIGVHESHRGHDIGTLLIEEAKRYAIANAALILLGEVENPEFFEEDSPAYGNPRKRVKFYSRFGCQRLEVPYFVPCFDENSERVFGVMLSLFPLTAEQETMTHLELPELSEFMIDFVGQDSDEALALIEASKGSVALTPYRSLL